MTIGHLSLMIVIFFGTSKIPEKSVKKAVDKVWAVTTLIYFPNMKFIDLLKRPPAVYFGGVRDRLKIALV